MKFDTLQSLRKELKRIDLALPKKLLKVSSQAYALSTVLESKQGAISGPLAISDLYADRHLLELCRNQLNHDFGGSCIVNKLIDRLTSNIDAALSKWKEDFKAPHTVCAYLESALKKQVKSTTLSFGSMYGYKNGIYTTAYIRPIVNKPMPYIVASFYDKEVEVCLVNTFKLPGCLPQGVFFNNKKAVTPYVLSCVKNLIS